MRIKYTTPSMVCAYDNNVEAVDLEDLRVDHLWQCIAYASKHKLLYQDGFCEWITPHLETDKDLAVMIHNYCVSTMTHQFKYGVELPQSAKHALELDKQNGDNKWAQAMRKEIMHSENDTVLHFSKGLLPQAKALQPPVSQAKKHPPNV